MATPPSWSVTVAGVTKVTTNRSLTFLELNGTYVYSIGAPSGYTLVSSSPASPVTVDGANVTVEVVFGVVAAPAELRVTFEESGLPYGTLWCVTLNGTVCSTGLTIVFPGLAPGTYGFNVSAVPGYSASPTAGSLTLSHRDLTVAVRFSSTAHHHCMEPFAGSP